METHPVVAAYLAKGWDGVRESFNGLSLDKQIEGLNKLMIHLRWEEKDLAGIAKAAQLAEELVGDTDDEAVLGNWKAVCFNRAAFVWRGWGDEDLTVTREEEATGDRFAILNLELGARLGRGAVPMGRAEWLVGAFAWSRGDKAEARDRFANSLELVKEGDDPLEVKMMEAYVGAVSGADVSGLLAELDAAPEGDFYATQVRNAMRILG